MDTMSIVRHSPTLNKVQLADLVSHGLECVHPCLMHAGGVVLTG